MKMDGMPRLVPPVVAAGSVSARSQPAIVAGPITLRPWRDRDADAVVQAYGDPDIQRWHCRRLDPDEAIDHLRNWHAGWADETGGCWAVAASAGDQVLGRVALRGLSLLEGDAEVSYWVLPPARRRGVATSAVLALTGWAFGELGLHRLTLGHSVRNAASCGVALAAGFEAEGTSRSAVLHQDGWHDMHRHARVSQQAAGAP